MGFLKRNGHCPFCIVKVGMDLVPKFEIVTVILCFIKFMFLLHFLKTGSALVKQILQNILQTFFDLAPVHHFLT